MRQQAAHSLADTRNTGAVAAKICKRLSPPSSVVAALLNELDGACFYRQEGWWTFELCVRRHVRQFHAADNVLVRCDATFQCLA